MNTKSKIGLIVVFLLISFLSSVSINQVLAQDDKYLKNQVKFSLTPCVYSNLKFNHFGEHLLYSRAIPSAEIAVSYYHHFIKGFGANIGVGYNQVPLNFRYGELETTNGTSIMPVRINHYYNAYISAPITVQKLFEIGKNNNFLITELGGKLNFRIGKPGSIDYALFDTQKGEQEEILRVNIQDCKEKVIVGYFLKFGLQHKLMNKNSLQFALVGHCSPTPFETGTFEFKNISKESKGDIFQYLNYVGLEITYGLTLSK